MRWLSVKQSSVILLHTVKKRVALFGNGNHALVIGVFESIPAYLRK